MAAYASQSVVRGSKRAELILSPLSPGYKPGVVMFKPDDIRAMTGDFDDCNFLGETQFGKVYRGKLVDPGDGTVKHVTVKIQDYKAKAMYGYTRMIDGEVTLLTNIEHPNLIKLIGVCRHEDVRAIVYDVNPLDMLQNLVMRDDYSWSQRLQAAFGLASLLEFLHLDNKYELPYLVLSHNLRHVLIDKNGEPLLFEFTLMSGGILGRMSALKSRSHVCDGYLDVAHYLDRRSQHCPPKYFSSDVFAYGVILLSLLAKSFVEKCGGPHQIFNLNVLGTEVYKPGNNIVHSSMEGDSGWGVDCTLDDLDSRPNMTEVLDLFRSLDIFIGGNIERYTSSGYVI